MTTFSRKHARGALTCLGAITLVGAALMSGCSSTESSVGAASGTNSGGSAGTSSGGGGAGSLGQAGGISSQAGSLSSAGSGGSAGTAGSGGSGGAAAPCLADDECCDDPNKTEPGECGCGIADLDSDGDGELNCKEECPQDPHKTEPEMCGCGLTENDSDDDGEIDCQPGHYFEAEDGVLSEELSAPVVEVGEGGAGGTGAGGDGAGGAASGSKSFSIGDDAKASAEQYLEAPAGFVADALPGPARASYEIDIPAQHSYVFWGRFYTPDRDHNRVWVKVDNGTWLKLRVTSGEAWFWYTFHKEGEFEKPMAFELAEGKHTLTVASDTDGVRIDRFYVTPGFDHPPGDDTTCSPPHSIQSGDVCLSSCGALLGNSCDAVMCEGKTALPAYDCEVCCKL